MYITKTMYATRKERVREREIEKETEKKERDLDHRETRYNNFIHHFLFSFFFGHQRLEVTKVHSLSNASTIDCTHKYRWHKCVQHVVPLCMETVAVRTVASACNTTTKWYSYHFLRHINADTIIIFVIMSPVIHTHALSHSLPHPNIRMSILYGIEFFDVFERTKRKISYRE